MHHTPPGFPGLQQRYAEGVNKILPRLGDSVPVSVQLKVLRLSVPAPSKPG
jgi:hypothetical protein